MREEGNGDRKWSLHNILKGWKWRICSGLYLWLLPLHRTSLHFLLWTWIQGGFCFAYNPLHVKLFTLKSMYCRVQRHDRLCQPTHTSIPCSPSFNTFPRPLMLMTLGYTKDQVCVHCGARRRGPHSPGSLLQLPRLSWLFLFNKTSFIETHASNWHRFSATLYFSRSFLYVYWIF